MAASDPTTDVPTPTGTLQGVAAFSWDGTNWQPSGRAGPSVATPYGVLRGVAAFNGGPSWQPSALAQPGVTTPTGTLDGVAVYTWSGSAWTPPGGQPTPSTPHGALRGVAAFNWDGAAWQPAAQAGPSVATPYGVLDGVAMFNWSGSAWAATAAPSLSLDFMTPGTLDPRITFTRASTATYFNSSGVMQTAAANAPRWDYNPSTLALNGLLIEETRTNAVLNSGDASNASWAKSNITVAAPVVTGAQIVAPDGTLTGARVVLPAVSAAGNATILNLLTEAATAAPYTISIWARGSVGGEQTYLFATPDGVTYYRTRITLTTAWQRFSLVTSNLDTRGWVMALGTDLRDASQTATLAQTIFVWGGQVEQGAFPTSYIPTTAAAVTRAADVATMLTSPWLSAGASTLYAETIHVTPPATNFHEVLASIDDGVTNRVMMFRFTNSNIVQGQIDPSVYNQGIGSLVPGAVTKAAIAYSNGAQSSALNAVMGPATAVATLPGSMSTLRFGLTYAGYPLNGYIRRARYWPRVLSNAELQAVTT